MNRRDALKSLLALPAVQSIEVARLRPDDTIIITAERRLCEAEVEAVEHVAKVAFPGRRVVVLDGGLKLSVVRGATEPC